MLLVLERQGRPTVTLLCVSQQLLTPASLLLFPTSASIIGQLAIFSARTNGVFFFQLRPSLFLVLAFIGAQFVATIIAVYGDWGFTEMHGVGWGYAAVAWVWSLVWFLALDTVDTIVTRVQRRGLHGLFAIHLSRHHGLHSGTFLGFANVGRAQHQLRQPRFSAAEAAARHASDRSMPAGGLTALTTQDRNRASLARRGMVARKAPAGGTETEAGSPRRSHLLTVSVL